MVMKIKTTVTIEMVHEIDDLESYEADTIEEAALNQYNWFCAQEAELFEMLCEYGKVASIDVVGEE